jgi:hypothetical protein
VCSVIFPESNCSNEAKKFSNAEVVEEGSGKGGRESKTRGVRAEGRVVEGERKREVLEREVEDKEGSSMSMVCSVFLRLFL